MLHACADAGEVMRAEAWLSKLARWQGPSGGDATWQPPGARAFNAVLLACARAGDPARAEAWLFEMIDRDVTPDVFTLNMLLNALASVADVAGVQRWFVRLLEAGVAPDAVTYRTALAACARAKNPPLAEEWLASMRAASHPPDVLGYSTLVAAHAAAGDSAGSEQWLRLMQAEGLSVDQVGYSLLISAWAGAAAARRGESDRWRPDASELGRAEGWLWKAVEAGVQPSDASLQSLLAAFVRADHPAGVRRTQAAMRRLGIWPSATACATMMRPYAIVGDITAAEQVLEGFRAEGGACDMACLRALLCAYARAPRCPRERAEACFWALHSMGAFAAPSAAGRSKAAGSRASRGIADFLGASPSSPTELLRDLRQAVGRERAEALAAQAGLPPPPDLEPRERRRIVGRVVELVPCDEPRRREATPDAPRSPAPVMGAAILGVRSGGSRPPRL